MTLKELESEFGVFSEASLSPESANSKKSSWAMTGTELGTSICTKVSQSGTHCGFLTSRYQTGVRKIVMKKTKERTKRRYVPTTGGKQ